MKRFFLFLIAAVSLLAASAYPKYYCTGDNVYVRTGPGKNYTPIYWGYDTRPYAQIDKGMVVEYLGETRNGYMRIRYDCGEYYEYGWIAKQYLRPAGGKISKKNKNKRR